MEHGVQSTKKSRIQNAARVRLRVHVPIHVRACIAQPPVLQFVNNNFSMNILQRFEIIGSIPAANNIRLKCLRKKNVCECIIHYSIRTFIA